MTEKKDNKFYWSAGVTKNEVIESLNDNGPSVYRNQFNRQALVLVTLVCLIGLSLLFFISQPKLKSYLEIFLLAIVLLLYTQLMNLSYLMKLYYYQHLMHLYPNLLMRI